MIPCIYMSEMDLPPQDIHGFKQWFAGRHAPDLYESGFLSCSCYRGVIGDVTIFDLYQLPSWDVLNTLPYTGLQMDDGKAYYSKVNRGGGTVIYDQAHIEEIVPESCSFRTRRWISVVRYDGDLPAIESVLRAGRDSYAEAGATRARYARRGKPHPRQGVHRRPEGISIIESESELAAMKLKTLLETTVPASAENVSFFVGERVVPWDLDQVNGD